GALSHTEAAMILVRLLSLSNGQAFTSTSGCRPLMLCLYVSLSLSFSLTLPLHHILSFFSLLSIYLFPSFLSPSSLALCLSVFLSVSLSLSLWQAQADLSWMV